MRIRKDELEEEISRLKEGQVLGVLSKLLPYYDSIFGPPTIHHLPLMDFNCPVCPENLSRVEEFLAKIGCHGVIMDSGNSYHYYGADLMEEKEWLDFLGNCLLSEFADARYIGHRLKDGCGILRISACPLRPKIPTVVSIL